MRVPDFFSTQASDGTARKCRFTFIGRDLYTQSYILESRILPKHYLEVNVERPDVTTRDKKNLGDIPSPQPQDINQHQILHIERCCNVHESTYIGPVWRWDLDTEGGGAWCWLYQHIDSGSFYIKPPSPGEVICLIEKQKQEDSIKEQKRVDPVNENTHNIHDCPHVRNAMKNEKNGKSNETAYTSEVGENQKTIRRSTRSYASTS